MAHTLTGTLHGNVIQLDANPSGPGRDPTAQRVRVVLEPLEHKRHDPARQGDADGAVLQELVSWGKMRSGARNDPESYPRLDPILTRGTAQELLNEDRDDR